MYKLLLGYANVENVTDAICTSLSARQVDRNMSIKALKW